jgi:glycerophosphoryl diester phosphodiesterase
MQPRLLYAHRGASAERPENTMIAFTRAVEIGVDALEMDVQLTRDGVLIVAHDDDAMRTCGVPRKWAELDLVDAQRLDAGWGFVGKDGTRPFNGHGVCVPTFAEVVRAFPEHRINVDLKGSASVDAMLSLVRELGAEGRITLASFQTTTAVRVRRRGYGGETGLSQGEVIALLGLPALAFRQLPFTGTAVQIPVKQGAIRFDRIAFIAKCHSLGLRVDYWVVDDPAEVTRLLELGADGIMTNDPAAVRAAFMAAPAQR